MKTFAALLALGVLRVSAKPQANTSFQSNSFNGMSKACRSLLPVVNTHIQTSVIENPTVSFPGYIPSTSVSESCHCLNTLVRPQIRNEFITVPTVDRIVRTVTSPIVETINCGGGTRLTTFTQANNILSGNAERRNSAEGLQGNVLTPTGNNNRLFNDVNAGGVFATGQSANSFNRAASINAADAGGISRPTIFTFQNPTARIINNSLQGCPSVFLGNFK